MQALTHKKDGNRYFQLKKYRNAIESYTEGIKIRCPDRTLNAQMFANRAAAHFHLGASNFPAFSHKIIFNFHRSL